MKHKYIAILFILAACEGSKDPGTGSESPGTTGMMESTSMMDMSTSSDSSSSSDSSTGERPDVLNPDVGTVCEVPWVDCRERCDFGCVNAYDCTAQEYLSCDTPFVPYGVVQDDGSSVWHDVAGCVCTDEWGNPLGFDPTVDCHQVPRCGG